VSGLN